MGGVAKTGTCSWGRAVPAYCLDGAGCLTRSSSRMGSPGWRPRFLVEQEHRSAAAADLDPAPRGSGGGHSTISGGLRPRVTVPATSSAVRRTTPHVDPDGRRFPGTGSRSRTRAIRLRSEVPAVPLRRAQVCRSKIRRSSRVFSTIISGRYQTSPRQGPAKIRRFKRGFCGTMGVRAEG